MKSSHIEIIIIYYFYKLTFKRTCKTACIYKLLDQNRNIGNNLLLYCQNVQQYFQKYYFYNVLNIFNSNNTFTPCMSNPSLLWINIQILHIYIFTRRLFSLLKLVSYLYIILLSIFLFFCYQRLWIVDLDNLYISIYTVAIYVYWLVWIAILHKYFVTDWNGECLTWDFKPSSHLGTIQWSWWNKTNNRYQ